MKDKLITQSEAFRAHVEFALSVSIASFKMMETIHELIAKDMPENKKKFYAVNSIVLNEIKSMKIETKQDAMKLKHIWKSYQSNLETIFQKPPKPEFASGGYIHKRN